MKTFFYTAPVSLLFIASFFILNIPVHAAGVNSDGSEMKSCATDTGKEGVTVNARGDCVELSALTGNGGGNQNTSGSPNPATQNTSGSPNPAVQNTSGSPNAATQNTSGSPNPSSSGTNVRLINPLGSGTTNLESFLNSILDFVIRIGTIVVVLMMVFVGFKFVTAQGDPGEITKAREMLLWTVVGALVLLGAKALAGGIEATVKALSVGK